MKNNNINNKKTKTKTKKKQRYSAKVVATIIVQMKDVSDSERH